MRSKKLSLAMTVVVSAVVLVLGVASTPAVAQTETTLHNFNNNGDGFNPYGGLIFDASGNLYGTANSGGAHGNGVVFELTPQAGGGWTENILHNFDGATGDGTFPAASLTFDSSGNLYGTTGAGGAHDWGTVFALHQSGSSWGEKVLYSFTGGGGNVPTGGLIFDTAGDIYGTTDNGGSGGCIDGCGTVFKLSPKFGVKKLLFAFGGTNGGHPQGGLIMDSAGNLYGTTQEGGSFTFCIFTGCGVVFELSRAESGLWTETVLWQFGSSSTDGIYPVSNLTFDSAGNLYGTTAGGGEFSGGTIFELSPAGGGTWTETILHSFANNNGTDGDAPIGGVIFDSGGNLWGTTSSGGSGGCKYFSGVSGCGTIYELSQSGGTWAESLVYSFNFADSSDNQANGPYGGLVFDASGNAYGTTLWGGTGVDGTVFKFTP